MSKVKYNKFEKRKFSVIAYRQKPLSLIIFVVSIILNMIAQSMTRSISSANEKDFLGVEKKGKVIKKLKKLSSGMTMMSILDVLFITGHQILHQQTDTRIIHPEYITTYLLSIAMFLYSVWKIAGMAQFFIGTSLQRIYQILKIAEKQIDSINQLKINKNKVAIKEMTRENSNTIDSGEKDSAENQLDQSEVHPLDGQDQGSTMNRETKRSMSQF